MSKGTPDYVKQIDIRYQTLPAIAARAPAMGYNSFNSNYSINAGGEAFVVRLTGDYRIYGISFCISADILHDLEEHFFIDVTVDGVAFKSNNLINCLKLYSPSMPPTGPKITTLDANNNVAYGHLLDGFDAGTTLDILVRNTGTMTCYANFWGAIGLYS